jgi:hypothetical protein
MTTASLTPVGHCTGSAGINTPRLGSWTSGQHSEQCGPRTISQGIRRVSLRIDEQDMERQEIEV